MKLIMRFVQIISFSFLICDPLCAATAVKIGERHMMMLKPGLDQLAGSYIFAVVNEGKKPVDYKFSVGLPKKTKDFRAQEGLKPEEISLNADGSLEIHAQFPPGTNIVSLGFLVDAKDGSVDFVFAPPQDIGQMLLLLDHNSMGVVSSQLQVFDPDHGGQFAQDYEAYMVQGTLKKDNELKATFTGIPTGRKFLYIGGASTALLLLMLSAFFAVRSFPRQDDGGELLCS